MKLTHPLIRTAILFVGLLFAGSLSAAEPAPRWSIAYLKQKPEWYASAAARTAADIVLQYQSPEGAWPKNTDLIKAPASAEALTKIHKGGEANTIDNGATVTPMRFIAEMTQATGEEKFKTAFIRGMDYLLAAQYSNGGWPQFYPLRTSGYYSHITYNDGAMINVMALLREIATGKPPFAFVDEARRAKAAAAVARGIVCILKTQIKQDGKPTVWCAQHDEKTLEPTWARKYEPPSLSGSESVGIVRFLMEVEKPTREIIASIEGAVAWLRAAAIQGIRIERFTDDNGKKDKRVIEDRAAPPLWARFYELGTSRPLYLGRDSVFHYAFSEIERERRSGYDYHGAWAESLLGKDYPRWREKHKQP